jgi:urease accessory protein
MKLLCPRRDSPAAWVYVSTYGGGLVGGDHLHMDMALGPGAVGVLGTQASTKVYRRRDGLGASSNLWARVEEDALLVVAPDPLVCFGDAAYEQQQIFSLDAGGSLVLVDWFTAGRLAHGERWAMQRYASRTVIDVAGRRMVTDAMTLDREDGPIDGALRVGRFNCFAALWLVGPMCGEAGQELYARIKSRPMGRGQDVLISAAAHPWGTLLRLAAVSTEQAAAELREAMGFLTPLLGAGPWDRKW